MNILYIAYSCDPFQGSEDKIGWNIPFESSKRNNVYVITKMEHKETIENFIKKNKINNLHFFFVDIHNFYKKIYKGIFYSGRLMKWNQKAYYIARKICEKNNIQIIHQITPVEFRAVGHYYDIPNIEFVVGPIGGAEYIPKFVLKYLSFKERYIEKIRCLLNIIYKYKNFNCKKIQKYDYIMFANKETREFCVKNYKNTEIYSEVGINRKDLYEKYTENKIVNKEKDFIVPGRLVYRKGHLLLLDAIKKVNKDLKFKVNIIGDGKYLERIQKIVKNSKLLSERVRVCGKKEYKEVMQDYKKSYALIMPSLRETTGTVLVEAISNNIPVITYNGFGAKIIFNETNSYLYNGNSKSELIDNLANKITECIINDNTYKLKKLRLQDITNNYLFENKIKHYEKVYKEVIEKSV